jgi:hypothetical protein
LAELIKGNGVKTKKKRKIPKMSAKATFWHGTPHWKKQKAGQPMNFFADRHFLIESSPPHKK